MRCVMTWLLVGGLGLGLAGQVSAQESQAAKATRKKLQQKLTLEVKELETGKVFEEINREIDQAVGFKVDAASGVSSNTKLTYKCKEVTLEKVLNELSDKYAFGWYVVSNAANNKVDGKVVIRRNDKGKERGYEAGKEPKKESSVERPLRELANQSPRVLPAFISAAGLILWVRED